MENREVCEMDQLKTITSPSSTELFYDGITGELGCGSGPRSSPELWAAQGNIGYVQATSRYLIYYLT